MKRAMFLMIIAFFTLNTFSAQYKLKFKVNNLPDTTVLLLKYLGDKLYYADTAEMENGVAVFEKEDYEGGLYAFYTGKSYFEFVMNDKVVEMETTNNNFVEDMKILKSDENKVFYDYIKFISNQKKKSEPFSKKLPTLDKEKDKKEYEKITDQLTQLDKEVKAYQKKLVQDHEGMLIAKLIRMNIDVEIPDELNDTLKGIYLRDHFWDNVDLGDKRLARTPVFKNKMDQYFKKMMHQIPDTIVRHAGLMIDQVEDSSGMLRYILNYIHTEYETSNIMGMDAVYVNMSEKYYCDPENSKAFWYPEENLKDRCDKVATLSPLIIGKVAPNLKLADTTEKKWVNIHNLDHDHKVLIFWDPECGHCKKEIPKLLKLYHELQDKKVDIEFIGIGTELNNDKWRKMIKDKNIDWMNLSDFEVANKNPGKYIYEMGVTDLQSLNFRKTYDIFSTPQIYLLDEDNKIIGKRLATENIARILENKLDIKLDYKEEKSEENKEEHEDK